MPNHVHFILVPERKEALVRALGRGAPALFVDNQRAATFEISTNDAIVYSQDFSDLSDAEAYFADSLIVLPVTAAGTIEMSFDETLSAGEGFSFNYDARTPPVPEASTWAMMLVGLAGLGLAGYRGSRKAASVAA